MTYSVREKRELRERWSPAMIDALNTGIGAVTTDTGTGRYEGRVDLRGISITGNVIYKTLAGLDLSCCSFERFGQFNLCRFEDCLFVGSDLRNNLKKTFSACSFQGARLSEITIGEAFNSCEFSDSRWSRVLAVRTEFTGCTFANVRLDQVKLLDCTFKQCQFEGARFRRSELEGTRFIGSGIDSDRFINCFMEGVRFEE